jgi:hypothetical protein
MEKATNVKNVASPNAQLLQNGTNMFINNIPTKEDYEIIDRIVTYKVTSSNDSTARALYEVEKSQEWLNDFFVKFKMLRAISIAIALNHVLLLYVMITRGLMLDYPDIFLPYMLYNVLVVWGIFWIFISWNFRVLVTKLF